MLCNPIGRYWFNLECVSEEVDVCTGGGGHDGHGERGIDILQVAPHWRLADIIKSIVNNAKVKIRQIVSHVTNSLRITRKISWSSGMGEITYNLVLKE